jgi:homoserine O-acetyltransferase
MRNMNLRFRTAFFSPIIYLAVCVTRTAAQVPSPEGIQQFVEFGDFRLRDGELLREFRLGYRILGKLNDDKSNAVLWPTWIGGKSEDLLPFVGPGNVVDTSKYFVVLVDAIGNGISTSPSNSKAQPLMKFPRFTIRDMVETERRLCTEVLDLKHLHAVIGISMGGMQAFEWVAAYPDFMDLGIPMAGSPQSTSYDKLFWTSEIDAIELHPAWNHGDPKGPLSRGVALSAEINSMNLTSPSYRGRQTSPNGFDAFLAGIRNNSKIDGGIASDQIRQREAIIAFDLPGEMRLTLEQTAKKTRARLLVVVTLEDHVVNPQPAIEFAAAINAPIVTINSSCGHQSFGCLSLGPIIAKFLTDPTSVHSETLQDPVNH